MDCVTGATVLVLKAAKVAGRAIGVRRARAKGRMRLAEDMVEAVGCVLACPGHQNTSLMGRLHTN